MTAPFLLESLFFIHSKRNLSITQNDANTLAADRDFFL
jgi:hypothetical protein